MLSLKTSIIHTSNQIVKWNSLMGLLLGSGIVVFLGVLALSLELFPMSDQQEMVCFFVILAGIALGILATICLSLFIKCPRCGLRWFWYGLAKDFKRNIMVGYMSHCQRCNYPLEPGVEERK